METLLRFPEDLSSAVRVIGMQYTKTKSGWVYPNHRHPYFEFLHCIEGQIRQWVNGQETVLLPGESLLIPANAQHHTETPESAVYFDFHFDVEEKGLYSVFQHITDSFIPSDAVLPESKTVSQWVSRFLTENSGNAGPTIAESPSPFNDPFIEMREAVHLLRMQMRMTDFLCRLADFYLSSPYKLNPYRSETMQPTQLKIAQETAYWIEKGIGEGIQIHEIAERLSLNRSYISQCFKSVYGISPSDYQSRIRIREAKKLLQKTDMTIEEIAERLAYSSSSHFGSVFRKAVGLSPKQFRQHLKQHAKG